MTARPIYLFLLLLIISCGTEPEVAKETTEELPIGAPYHAQVGDIPFDPEQDDSNFQLCNERVLQYYNFSKGIMYEGERPALIEQIERSYSKDKEVDGFITVRFVVNCKGETDRFRTVFMDNEYVEQTGHEALKEQFEAIMRSCQGWLPADYDGTPFPYHQYMTIRLEKGEITRIIP